MRWPWRRKLRHQHDWFTVGYGGAGWYLIRCRDCGEKDISP
jgi:hypothetical protein